MLLDCSDVGHLTPQFGSDYYLIFNMCGANATMFLG